MQESVTLEEMDSVVENWGPAAHGLNKDIIENSKAYATAVIVAHQLHGAEATFRALASCTGVALELGVVIGLRIAEQRAKKAVQ